MLDDFTQLVEIVDGDSCVFLGTVVIDSGDTDIESCWVRRTHLLENILRFEIKDEVAHSYCCISVISPQQPVTTSDMMAET